MRKQLVAVCTAAFLISSVSHASKARLSALQFASFWTDTQNVFQYPQMATELGQYLTLEAGAVGTTGIHAEGGFARKFGDNYAGAYLGHQNANIQTTYAPQGLTQNNPLFLYYAMGGMGFGLNLSYSDIKSTTKKDMGIGLAFGMKMSSINLGLSATVFQKGTTAAANSAKVLPDVKLDVNTDMGDLKVYGSAQLVRYDAGGVASTSETGYNFYVGAQDHAYKLTNGSFFYGAQIGYGKTPTSVSTTTTVGTVTTTTTVLGTAKGLDLPIYAGLESDILTWFAVRGAVSQSLLAFTDTGVKDINAENTKVSLGSTLKTGGFAFDTLFALATTGAVNAVTFATNAAVTYKF